MSQVNEQERIKDLNQHFNNNITKSDTDYIIIAKPISSCINNLKAFT